MLCIIQARMSSRRFPGKMLTPLKEVVLLQRVVDAARRATMLRKVMVATSDEDSDDAIANYCRMNHIPFHRGPLNNVALRFKQLIELEGDEAFLRISGDSPVMDHRLLDRAVSLYQVGGCDLVTNVGTRTFPKGQSVELVSSKAFLNTVQRMSEPHHLEHVTTYFYENREVFRMVNFTSGVDAGTVNLSVDTPEDLARIETVLDASVSKSPSWQELANVYQQKFGVNVSA